MPDNGQPCLTPLYNGKNSEAHPLLMTQLVISIYSTFIHFRICGSKLNISRTLAKKSQFTESKAFLKSIKIAMTGKFSSEVIFIISCINLMFCPMYRSFTYPVWSSCISLGRTLLILLRMVLGKLCNRCSVGILVSNFLSKACFYVFFGAALMISWHCVMFKVSVG